ncbi:MAG: radical SAM protein [Candidatus Marinimicrobia bacterium]|nr:radical SAM protein [Candidatus Neomarinimicrobiota bacterium]
MEKVLPSLVVSDGNGNVIDINEFYPAGSSGRFIKHIPEDEWIPLPDGSKIFELPGRLPIGINKRTGDVVILESEKGENIMAVAAFPAPAYTITYLACYENIENAPVLPLFAYSAIGWYEGRFFIPAIRIDNDIRQDPSQFNLRWIKKNAKKFLKEYKNNRLARHLIENCALTYHCPAAQNYLLNRWEMPVPTSRKCNARCIGCISFQPDSCIPCTQNRMNFTPTVDEIVEIVVPHIETAPLPIVSFGQGCEGEPLLNGDLLAESIKKIRAKTKKGTINLNTNASKPETVKELRKSGLDSMRVSLNSVREKYYMKYFKPIDYNFEDILKSIEVMKRLGGFVSINYFTIAGFTDQPDEVDEAIRLIKEFKIDMIQWRNLNIDPDYYFDKLKIDNIEGIGIRRAMAEIKKKIPSIKYGYFNPYLG